MPSGTHEEQHPCAAERCASAKTAERPDGTRERIPGFTYQVFCPACTDKIVEALTELPGAYSRIEEEYGSPVRRSDQAIRTPFGPSVLIRLDVDALQREAPPIIGGWAARVRKVPGVHVSSEHDDPATPGGFAEACKVLRLNPGPLLSLQAGWMTRTYRFPVGRPGREPLSPIPPAVEEEIGALEILHTGVDFVTVQVPCDGATAGNEILSLQWRSTAVLGELRTKPQELLGVPCRADGCGWMSLVRAEPPADPDDPGYYSVCTRCRNRMADEEYREWVALCAAYERNKRRTPATLENLPGVA
jgi:hypothetical protein